MLIRRARKEDYAAFAAIEAQYPGFPSWGVEGFAGEEQNSRSVTLAAEEGGAAAGFINFWVLRPQVQLNLLAVKKELSRRGVASALAGKMLEYARKSACTEVDLEVNERNEGAILFYKGQGFEVVGSRPKFYNNADAAVLMRKRI